MRVEDHPILGKMEDRKEVTIFYNEKPIKAFEGELLPQTYGTGIKSFRTTAKRNEPRGIFCAIGRCTDCMMVVDGIPNTRTCVTMVKDGMKVETQKGLARISRHKD